MRRRQRSTREMYDALYGNARSRDEEPSAPPAARDRDGNEVAGGAAAAVRGLGVSISSSSSSSSSSSAAESEDEEDQDYWGRGIASDSANSLINVVERRSTYNTKYRVYDREYVIRFKDDTTRIETRLDKRQILTRILREIVSYATRRLPEFRPEVDMIRLILFNVRFNTPISSEITCANPVRGLIDKVMAILTSDESIRLERTTFHVQLIPLPSGRGKRRILNLSNDKRLKRCVLSIENTGDTLCGLRAIVAALTYVRRDIMGHRLSDNDVAYIRKGRLLQTTLAFQLRDLLGDEFDDEVGCTLNDIARCEDIFRTRIKVVSSEKFNSVIYPGSAQYTDTVYLYYHASKHYDVITSIKALLGSCYFCERCDSSYNNRGRHVCRKDISGKDICNVCTRVHGGRVGDDQSLSGRVLCAECNRYCKNEICRRLHKEAGVCATLYRCTDCGFLERRENRRTHSCGVRRCRNCGQRVLLVTHRCHMKVVAAKGGYCSTPRCICKSESLPIPAAATSDNNRSSTVARAPDTGMCDYQELYGRDTLLLRRTIKQRYSELTKERYSNNRKPRRLDSISGSQAPSDFAPIVRAYHLLNEALDGWDRAEDAYDLERNFEIHDFIRTWRGELLVLNIDPPRCGQCAPTPQFSPATSDVDMLDYDEDDLLDDSVPVTRAADCTFTTKYMFYDYECTQETGQHVPNLIVAANYEGARWIFKTNNEFCSWAIAKRHVGYTFLAHYARGYDVYFVLRYCLENGMVPKIISQGSKVTLLTVTALRIRFIDSHNFVVGTPLAQFPKTFGLTEMKKGWFPHYFNTVANRDYAGPIPAVEFYGCDDMKPARRAEFLAWHAERVAENYFFDLQKELLEYCCSDVDLLRRGCMKLRRQFLETVNIDPFCYSTLPGVCMAIYRSRYLLPDTIAAGGTFHKRDQFSKESIAWLQSLPNAAAIRHACNGGEVRIAGAPVDGFDERTRTVYQFHGCYFHGCLRCYPDRDVVNAKLEQEMGDLYQRTAARSAIIRSAGYTLIEQWECAWKRDPLYATVDWNDIVGPLNPRDAYYGGRVETFKLYANVLGRTGEKILYTDVVSLYPAVMRYDKYPLSYPKAKLIDPPAFKPEWFGLIKCRVVAPYTLYIPVLPVRIKCKSALRGNTYEKLTFPLCRTCAGLGHEAVVPCPHDTDRERSFVGEWTTEEIKLALEKGYRILRIYEVWDFDSTTDLFRAYIDTFMKLKLQASPYTGSVDRYIAHVAEKMGLILDVDNVAVNPVLRTIAKLCMNALYGKFGQRDNLDTTEFVMDVERFYQLLLNTSLKVTDVLPINDEIVQVKYRRRIEDKRDDFNTNVLVALFTTSNARIRLFKELDKVGERALYCDTDSIVYIDDGCSYTIPRGEALGEFADELSEDDYIVTWISTGPKSYYYLTKKGITSTKMKGFTLNHKLLETVNARSMKQLIDGEVSLVDKCKRITRDPATKQLINRTQKKRITCDYNKRVITRNYNTVPYGYRCN